MFEADGSLNTTYSLYIVLELKPPCSDDAISKAYRKLALKYHPDKTTGNLEKFNEIKMAHDTLKDPIKRKFYDRFGDKGMQFVISDPVSGMNLTSSFLGRMVLRILTRPTRLIPIFLIVAFINYCIVLFLYVFDKKMYFGGLKWVSWYLIFSPLWFYLFCIISVAVFSLFFVIKNSKSAYEFNYTSADSKQIPQSIRKHFAIAQIAIFIFSFISFITYLIIIIYCTYQMALNFDENGKLAGGITWADLLYPSTIFINFYFTLTFIFDSVTQIFIKNAQRNWKDKTIIFFGYFYETSLILFNYLFINWLDSSSREQIQLFKAFSVLYLLIFYSPIQFYVHLKWTKEDLYKSMIEKLESSNTEEIEVELNRVIKVRRAIYYIGLFFILLTVLFYHLHFAGYWPYSLRMTNFVFVMFIYIVSLIFGVLLPILVVLMDRTFPENSFDLFNKASLDDENITIIDIPSIRFKYGFGFAPFQPTIRN